MNEAAIKSREERFFWQFNKTANKRLHFKSGHILYAYLVLGEMAKVDYQSEYHISTSIVDEKSFLFEVKINSGVTDTIVAVEVAFPNAHSDKGVINTSVWQKRLGCYPTARSNSTYELPDLAEGISDKLNNFEEFKLQTD